MQLHQTTNNTKLNPTTAITPHYSNYTNYRNYIKLHQLHLTTPFTLNYNDYTKYRNYKNYCNYTKLLQLQELYQLQQPHKLQKTIATTPIYINYLHRNYPDINFSIFVTVVIDHRLFNVSVLSRLYRSTPGGLEPTSRQDTLHLE